MRCRGKDGNKTTNGHRLCKECERKFRQDVTAIGRDAATPFDIASRRTNPGKDATGVKTTPATPTSPLRAEPWDLYCETEQLMRLAAMACGRTPATDGKATVPALARTVLADPTPLLTAADAHTWAEDMAATARQIRRIVEPVVPRVAFGACPSCGKTVWGEPADQMGECSGCHSLVSRWYVSDRLLKRLEEADLTGTPTKLSRECAKAGIRLPASTIRGWIHKDKVRPDEHGELRLGDIIPLIRQRAQT